MSDKQSNFDISDEMIAERRRTSNKMPEDMPSWMANTILRIDKFSYRYMPIYARYLFDH